MADEPTPDPWTLPARRDPKRSLTRRKAPAKAPAKKAKAAAAHKRATPKRQPARPARKPARKAARKPTAASPPPVVLAPARRPLDITIQMRPVRPAAPTAAVAAATPPQARPSIARPAPPSPPTPAPVPRPVARPMVAVAAAPAVRPHAAPAPAPAPAAIPKPAVPKPALPKAAVPKAVPKVAVPTAAAPKAPAASAAPAPKRRRMRAVLTVGTALALALVAAAVVMPASSEGNSGTIKVHDDATAAPPTRNEPHVDCEDFWIEGFNMAADSGHLLFYSWPPHGAKELVLQGNWSADGAEPANHFLAGPFALAPGHYRVFASNGEQTADGSQDQDGNRNHDDDADGGFGGMKKKTFWVEPCQPPAEDIPCPTDLAAVANADGSVTLTWTPAEGADGTNVYRADGDGDFAYLDTLHGAEDGRYTDNTTVPGHAYTYRVTSFFAGGDCFEGGSCSVEVEVTAIPEFPTLAALGLATGGGALAMLLLRRRRA